jgi:hypothetical protein
MEQQTGIEKVVNQSDGQRTTKTLSSVETKRTYTTRKTIQTTAVKYAERALAP